MGTEFFWFYDVLIVAIIAAITFRGIKRGFVRMIFSLAAIVASFLLSLFISGAVSDRIYTDVVEQPLQKTITEAIDNTIGETPIAQIRDVDMKKAEINGVSLDKLELKPDDAGKVTVDLTKLDLTDTGIDKIDLSAFGIDKEVDYSSLNLGTVQIYESDIEKYGVENMLLTEVLTDNIDNSEISSAVDNVIDEVNKAVPQLNITKENLPFLDKNLVNNVVVSVVGSDGDPGKALLDNMVKPMILLPLKTLIFLVLFVIILLLLSLVIKLTSVVNRLPLVGTVNKILGGAAGALYAFVVVFIVVILVHMVTAISNNTLIFLNEMTINKSFAFNYVYNFEFLNLIG